MARTGLSLVIALSVVGSAFCQIGPTLVGSGYGRPSYLAIAPGQILTLQLAGMKTILKSPARATAAPLPTTLAGFSVKIDQHLPLTDPLPAVPIVAVSQRNFCPTDPVTAASDCLITFVTIQVPFELIFNLRDQLIQLRCDAAYPGKGCPPTDLQISENGIVSKTFVATPVNNNIHIVTNCDLEALADTTVTVPWNPGTVAPSPCQSIATHADGTQISASSPAVAGEVVVLYAWGLGVTTPMGTTGDVAKNALASGGGSVQFAFSPNAAPAKLYGGFFPFDYEFTPRFAGLVQGQIGLYSINVKIPDTVITVQNCDTDIYSNLTISVGSSSSFDGAAICVMRNF